MTIQSTTFRQWFGESKVVDEHGNPLVVYHGTTETFTHFSERESGAFFSDCRKTAGGYGDPIAVHLSLKNPVVINAQYNFWNELDLIDSVELDELRRYSGKIAVMDHIKSAAEKAGYDGAIVRNVADNGGVGTQYIAFHPSQIKKVDDIASDFDPLAIDIFDSSATRFVDWKRDPSVDECFSP